MAQTTNLITYEMKGFDNQVVKQESSVKNTEALVSQIIAVMTIIGVIYFALQIILAGYRFMNTKGDQKLMEAARHSITSGILGIAIIIFAVGIASLIAKVLGFDNAFELSNIIK